MKKVEMFESTSGSKSTTWTNKRNTDSQDEEDIKDANEAGRVALTASTSELGADFCFPIRELSNLRVKLTPFVPSAHADIFFERIKPYQVELLQHMPLGPFDSTEDFIQTFLKDVVHTDSSMTTYAIIDLTYISQSDTEDEREKVAGMISWMETSITNRSAVIGDVVILPAFQRTHVTTNAIGLLLNHAFETEAQGGMGMRRVVWRCSSANYASQKTAEKMGFTKDGVLRNDIVFKGGRANGKVGNGRSVNDGIDGDLAMDRIWYSILRDEWEEKIKDVVRQIMARGIC